MKPIQKDGPKKEWRGERYRGGKGGASTNLKRTLQHNLNIVSSLLIIFWDNERACFEYSLTSVSMWQNWATSIKHAFLFVLFGLFGGRDTFSRNALLAMAPLSFLLQTRPVKLMSKELFYLLSNPPAVLLSFLSAPAKAILTVSEAEIHEILYPSNMNDVSTEQAKDPANMDAEQEETEQDRTASTIDEDDEEEEDEGESEEEDEYDEESEEDDE